MAKVKPEHLRPEAITGLRGVVSFRDTKYGPVAQKWPRKRGTVKSGAQFLATLEFTIAAGWAAQASDLQLGTARVMAKGHRVNPRDLPTMVAFGRVEPITFDDGTILRSRRTVYPNVQALLDDISRTQGAILIRGTLGWVGLLPGESGMVLTMNGGFPDWDQRRMIQYQPGVAAAPGDMLTFHDGVWNPLRVGTAGEYLTIDGGLPIWKSVETPPVVLGRTLAGPGGIAELDLNTLLDYFGSDAEGTILYRGAAGWEALEPGAFGQVLNSGGPGSPPFWADGAGGGGGGGGGTGPIAIPTTSARYWRFRETAFSGHPSIGELRFRKLGSPMATPAAYISSGDFGGLPASAAFDNDSGTAWAADSAVANKWVGVDFGAAVEVNVISILGRISAGQYPTAGAVEYSTDGSTWVTAWTVTGMTNAGIDKNIMVADAGLVCFPDPNMTLTNRVLWRLRVSAHSDDATTLTELRMSKLINGTNLLSALGDYMFSSGTFGSGYVPAHLEDADTSTLWAANTTPCQVTAELEAGYAIVEVGCKPRGNGFGGVQQVPTAMKLQSSPDNEVWTDEHDWVDLSTGWVVDTERSLIV